MQNAECRIEKRRPDRRRFLNSSFCVLHSSATKKPRPAWGAGRGRGYLLDVRGVNARGRDNKSVRFKEDFKRYIFEAGSYNRKQIPACPSSNAILFIRPNYHTLCEKFLNVTAM